MINIPALQPGDLILTASPGQRESELIRAVTGSGYSHALLVLEPPWAIESSDHGVVKFRLDRFAVRSLDNIVVRRVKREYMQQLDRAALLAFAERQKSKEYADGDVFGSLVSVFPRFQQGKYFCSQLVAEAYSQAGLPLIDDRQPEKTTPGMLAASDRMESLPASAVLTFRRARDLRIVPAFLDGPNSPSPAEQEADAQQRVVRQIARLFRQHGRVVHDFYEALHAVVESWAEKVPSAMGLDQALAEAILGSGLLQLRAELFPCHSHDLFVDHYVRHAIVLGQLGIPEQRDLLDRYRAEQVRLQQTNRERDEDVTKFRELYARTGSESVRLHLAGCWDTYLYSRRVEIARGHAIETLEASLQREGRQE